MVCLSSESEKNNQTRWNCEPMRLPDPCPTSNIDQIAAVKCRSFMFSLALSMSMVALTVSASIAAHHVPAEFNSALSTNPLGRDNEPVDNLRQLEGPFWL